MRWISKLLFANCYSAILGAVVVLCSFGILWSQNSSAPAVPSTQTPPPTPALPTSQLSRPLVMIDPAHGGSESGAVLNPLILEKDVTLALARRLRQDLTAHGVFTELVRDADVSLSTDDRAAKANAEHPELYLCLHASSQSNGLKVFSAMLPESSDERGPFVSWEAAQSASLPNSRAAQQQIVSAIQATGLSARGLIAPLRPLNNVVAAAIAVEIAPTGIDVSQLTSPDYQQTISTALANAIANYISAQGGTSGPPK